MKSKLLLLCLLFLRSSVSLTSTVRTLQVQAAPMFAFGPNEYLRDAGPPDTFTETFQHSGTFSCQFVVVNGKSDGTQRISSSSISLNGKQIVGPEDFNQQIGVIVKPVVLAS